MYAFLRNTRHLRSRMYAFLRVPAPLGSTIYAFLRVPARLGSTIYAFLRVSTRLGVKSMHDPSINNENTCVFTHFDNQINKNASFFIRRRLFGHEF